MPSDLTNNAAKKFEFVFIKSEYKAYKVKFKDIIYCEGMRDYTLVHLNNKTKPIVTLQNLKTFTGRLPEDEFIRVHRSYVVSLSNIDCISKNEVLIGKKSIPIGESYRESFNRLIEPYF